MFVLKWDKDCENAFKRAKKEVASNQVLTHFDPMWPLCLYCGVSKNGIGAVLLQVLNDESKRTIGFAGQNLTQT